MDNIALAIRSITALADMIRQISDTIGTAQAEGRDLTDAELDALVQKRKAAVDRLLSR